MCAFYTGCSHGVKEVYRAGGGVQWLRREKKSTPTWREGELLRLAHLAARHDQHVHLHRLSDLTVPVLRNCTDQVSLKK